MGWLSSIFGKKANTDGIAVSVEIARAIETISSPSRDQNAWRITEEAKATILASKDAAVPLLIQALGNPSINGIRLISILSDPSYCKQTLIDERWMRALVECLNDPREQVADSAANALVTHRSIEAMTAVCGYILQRKSSDYALGNITRSIRSNWLDAYKTIPNFGDAIGVAIMRREPIYSDLSKLVREQKLQLRISRSDIEKAVQECMRNGPTVDRLERLELILAPEALDSLLPLKSMWGEVAVDLAQQTMARYASTGPAVEFTHSEEVQRELLDCKAVPRPTRQSQIITGQSPAYAENVLREALAAIGRREPASIGVTQDEPYFVSRVLQWRALNEISEGWGPNWSFLILRARKHEIQPQFVELKVGAMDQHLLSDRLYRTRSLADLRRILPPGTLEHVGQSFGYSNFAFPGNALVSTKEFDLMVRDINAGHYEVMEVLAPSQLPAVDVPAEISARYQMSNPRHWNNFRRKTLVSASNEVLQNSWYDYFNSNPIPGAR